MSFQAGVTDGNQRNVERQAGAREGSRQTNFSPALLALYCLLILEIAVVWSLPRFLTQDGPAHLYNAALLQNLFSPARSGIDSLYRLNPMPVPNWGSEAGLAILMRLFGPTNAEKLLVSAYLLFFCAGFVYLLRSLRDDADFLAPLGIVFANNFLLGMGFYNFCCSTAIFLFAFGYWLRRREAFGRRQFAALAGFGVLAYFTHIFGFLMIEFFIGVMAVSYALPELLSPGQRGSRPWSKVLQPIVLPQLALAPCLVAAAVFLRGSYGENFRTGFPFRERLLVYRALFMFVDTMRRADKAFIVVLALFLLGCFSWQVIRRLRTKTLVAADALLLASLLFTVLYVVAPDSLFGGGFLSERLAFFAVCSAVLWMGSQSWGRISRRVVATAAVVLAVFALCTRFQWRTQTSHLLDSYEQAAAFIPPGSTVLSLCYCSPEDNRTPGLAEVRPFVLFHAAGLTALKSRSLLLYDYEAIGNTFPIEYQPAEDFYERLPLGSFKSLVSNISYDPGRIDLDDFERQTSLPVDNVLIWGQPATNLDESATFPLFAKLQAAYQLVYVAPPPGRLRLFRHIKAIASDSAAR